MMWSYLLVTILVYLVHIYLKLKHSLWSKRGVKGPAPMPVFGNVTNILFQKDAFAEYFMKIYEQYPEESIVGLYSGYKPMMLLRDPKIIKDILIKDFHLFRNRGLTPSRGKINQNLIVAEDETWKILRQNLTPVFTSKKIKDMVPLIQKSAKNLVCCVQDLINIKSEQEIHQLIRKFATQATSSCVFSVDTNTFSHEGNELNSLEFSANFTSKVSIILDTVFPGIRKFIYTNLQIERSFTNYVRNVIKKKIEEPKNTKDLLDLIISFQQRGKLSRRSDNGNTHIEIDQELLFAQVAVFYFAGVEPTSWLISYILYELSLNQKIQDRLYDEICKVYEESDDELTYNTINDMLYLDMVVNETLRKYPIATTVFRENNTDYTVPGSEIVIPKGSSIIISIGGLLNDPKYFTNPKIFNPDNFSPDNKKRIPQGVNMSFGDGPRNCIGMRFALITTKIAIISFIKNFKVTPSDKIKAKLDLEMFSVLYSTKDGVSVHITKR